MANGLMMMCVVLSLFVVAGMIGLLIRQAYYAALLMKKDEE
jgi:hypothetical protein